MKLYFTKGACSLVVRIIINELKLPCDYIEVDLKNKRTEKGEDFFNINPKGAVPTFVTEDNEILTENAIILQYLADTYEGTDLLPKLGNFGRYRVLEWVNYVATELHKTFGGMFRFKDNAELMNNFFIPLLKSKFNYVNQYLAEHKYLFSDHFTLPDAYLFVMTNWALAFKIDLNEWPNIARYREELLMRAAIKQSLKEEKLL